MTCTDEDGDGAGIGPSCATVDRNDANPSVSPAAPEARDGVDDDSDGRVDEDDACGPLPAICNGGDDDKDGRVDEGGVCDTSSETCNAVGDDQSGAVHDVPTLGEPCAAPAIQGPTGLDCTNTGRLACSTAPGHLECRATPGTIDCTASCDGTGISVRVKPYGRRELPGMVSQNVPGSGYSRPITVTFRPPVARRDHLRGP